MLTKDAVHRLISAYEFARNGTTIAEGELFPNFVHVIRMLSTYCIILQDHEGNTYTLANEQLVMPAEAIIERRNGYSSHVGELGGDIRRKALEILEDNEFTVFMLKQEAV